MSEFFLELFSEEIPAGLQKNLREKLLDQFQRFFLEKSIKSKKSFSLSTPNRLIIVFEGLDKQIRISSKEIRGPKIDAPDQALEGFLRSNKIEKKNIFKKKTEKGEFYYCKTTSKLLKTPSKVYGDNQSLSAMNQFPITLEEEVIHIMIPKSPTGTRGSRRSAAGRPRPGRSGPGSCPCRPAPRIAPRRRRSSAHARPGSRHLSGAHSTTYLT